MNVFLENEFYISIITALEFLIGEYKLEKDPKKALQTNDEIVVEATKTYITLEKKGKKISINDILIAATAKFLDLVVITSDKIHFERLRDIIKVKYI